MGDYAFMVCSHPVSCLVGMHVNERDVLLNLEKEKLAILKISATSYLSPVKSCIYTIK